MSVANKPGTYNNFTGKIEYKKTDCKVKDATFEILHIPKKFKDRIDIWIEFKKGTMLGGCLLDTIVEYCNIQGGNLLYSVFRDGVFNGDKFSASYWIAGKWLSGDWGEGFDKFGRVRFFPPPFDKSDKVKGVIKGVITEPGRYLDFTGRVKFGQSDFMIENGDIEIRDYSYHNLNISFGTISSGNVCYAIIDQVIFDGNKVQSCVWQDGTFNKGVFRSSYWKGGAWKNGKWHSGYDKNGKYHEKDDSPDKWDL